MAGRRRSGSSGHAVAALAARQHGVVSRGQLRALGLGDGEIDLRISAGTLHPVFRGAFAVGHPAIGRRGRMRAATLVCGEGAVASHRSAAELHGLWDSRPVSVEVIAPSWAGRKIDGIRPHFVRPPTADEVTVVDGIRCTAASRTIVDLAGSLGERALRRLVEQAAVLDLLDVPEVDRVLARGRRRGAPLLRAILAEWRTGEEASPLLRSPMEARFHAALVAAGLPLPRVNAVLWIGGRRLEVDFLWEEQRLVIETDGERTHGTRAAFRRDRWRDQLLTAAGYRTSRIAWEHLEHEPTATLERVRAMLETSAPGE